MKLLRKYRYRILRRVLQLGLLIGFFSWLKSQLAQL